MTQIRLENVRKTFGKAQIIKGIDLNIEDHEFVVFVGPSGCGKSTLLRLIAGLEDITSGDLFIGGERVNDLPPSERGIAMVFQSYALYPHMTVRQNMGFGLKLARTGKEAIERKVQEAAEMLQITHLLNHKPKQLSGGQRQRVAIGRAIVRNPRVFLFDEPLSNLDAGLRVQTRIEIARLHARLDATMIYVTHDQVEAMTLADKIVVLRAGQIEQVGSPLELYHHPQSLFVAGFIGSPTMNFINTEVLAAQGESIRVRIPGGGVLDVPVLAGSAAKGQKVTLGVRPEHVQIVTPQNPFDGEAVRARVLLVEELGGESYVYVTLENGEQLTVKVAGDVDVREDDMLTLGLPATCCHLFDAEERAFRRLETGHTPGTAIPVRNAPGAGAATQAAPARTAGKAAQG